MARGPASSGISFRQDIAPILVANCVDCHRPGRPGLDKGKLELTSFATLMQGTPKEKVIEPGKPEASHLVSRLKGDEQPRMPRGENNQGLSAEVIGRFEQWIKAGARLDAGLDPKAALGSYALSPEEARKRQAHGQTAPGKTLVANLPEASRARDQAAEALSVSSGSVESASKVIRRAAQHYPTYTPKKSSTIPASAFRSITF
jgi:hypothetical protein